MKRTLIFTLLISILVSAKAQSPVQVTQPYQYNKYVNVLDSLISKNISLPRQTSFPTPKRTGQLCNKLDTIYYYNGTTWIKLTESKVYSGSQTIIVRNDSVIADTTSRGYSLITKTQLTAGLAGLEPPAGGYANNLYLDTLTSVVVPTYKTLTYTPSLNTYNQAMTVNSSEGDKLIATFIYPTGVGETLYPSGLWSFNFYGSVSSASGVSQIGIQYFKRSITNVETNLFTIWSSDVENITNDWIKFNTTQPTFTVAETDRMGARLYVRTTSVTNRTITVTIGDGYGSYIGNPNRIRHSQLRALNGDTSFLHVTATEKNTWNNKLSAVGTAANSNLIQGKDTTWIKAQGGSSYTFNNGLTNNSGTVGLGGTINSATSINLGTTGSYNIYGTNASDGYQYGISLEPQSNGIVISSAHPGDKATIVVTNDDVSIRSSNLYYRDGANALKATISGSGIDLPTGSTFSVNGVPIGGGTTYTGKVMIDSISKRQNLPSSKKISFGKLNNQIYPYQMTGNTILLVDTANSISGASTIYQILGNSGSKLIHSQPWSPVDSSNTNRSINTSTGMLYTWLGGCFGSGNYRRFKFNLIDSVLAPGTPLTLNAPGSFQATAVSQSQIDLSWTLPSPNGRNFQIYDSIVGVSSNFTNILNSPTKTATLYNHTGLSNGQHVYYKIRTVGNGSDTLTSAFATANATTSTLTTLGTPTLNTPTVVSSTEIDLACASNISNNSGYDWIISRDGGTNYTALASTSTNIYTYNFTTGHADSLYYFKVRAHGDLVTYNHSAYSVEQNATTSSETPYSFAPNNAAGSTTNYLTFTPSSGLNFGSSPFSISFWYRSPSSTSHTTTNIIYTRTDGTFQSILVYENGTNGIQLFLQSSSGNYILDQTGFLSQDVWHFITLTCNGSSLSSGLTVYVDGSATTQSRDAAGTYTSLPNTGNCYFGTLPAASGKSVYNLQEFAIFNKELSSGEVATLYNSGHVLNIINTSLNSNLVSFWRFYNNGTDKKGNNNATSIGTPVFSNSIIAP